MAIAITIYDLRSAGATDAFMTFCDPLEGNLALTISVPSDKKWKYSEA